MTNDGIVSAWKQIGLMACWTLHSGRSILHQARELQPLWEAGPGREMCWELLETQPEPARALQPTGIAIFHPSLTAGNGHGAEFGSLWSLGTAKHWAHLVTLLQTFSFLFLLQIFFPLIILFFFFSLSSPFLPLPPALFSLFSLIFYPVLRKLINDSLRSSLGELRSYGDRKKRFISRALREAVHIKIMHFVLSLLTPVPQTSSWYQLGSVCVNSPFVGLGISDGRGVSCAI